MIENDRSGSNFQSRGEAERQVRQGIFEPLDPIVDHVFDDGIIGVMRMPDGSLTLVTGHEKVDPPTGTITGIHAIYGRFKDRLGFPRAKIEQEPTIMLGEEIFDADELDRAWLAGELTPEEIAQLNNKG